MKYYALQYWDGHEWRNYRTYYCDAFDARSQKRANEFLLPYMDIGKLRKKYNFRVVKMIESEVRVYKKEAE